METHGFEGPAPEGRFQADSGIRHRPVEGPQIHVALFHPHHTISFQSSASRFFQPWWRMYPSPAACPAVSGVPPRVCSSQAQVSSASSLPAFRRIRCHLSSPSS